MGTQSCLVVKS